MAIHRPYMPICPGWASPFGYPLPPKYPRNSNQTYTFKTWIIYKIWTTNIYGSTYNNALVKIMHGNLITKAKPPRWFDFGQNKYRISGIFRGGKFWRKCRLKGVLNFHWVLFSLFQGLSVKTYSRVYFSLCLLLAISGRSRTQRKLNPRENFPIYGTTNQPWSIVKLTYICPNGREVHQSFYAHKEVEMWKKILRIRKHNWINIIGSIFSSFRILEPHYYIFTKLSMLENLHIDLIGFSSYVCCLWEQTFHVIHNGTYSFPLTNFSIHWPSQVIQNHIIIIC